MSVALFPRRFGFGDVQDAYALLRQLIGEGLLNHFNNVSEPEAIGDLNGRIAAIGYDAALAETRAAVQAQPINSNPPAWIAQLAAAPQPHPGTVLGPPQPPVLGDDTTLGPPPPIELPAPAPAPITATTQPDGTLQISHSPGTAAPDFLSSIENTISDALSGIAAQTGLSVSTIEIGLAVLVIGGLWYWQSSGKKR